MINDESREDWNIKHLFKTKRDLFSFHPNYI